MKTTAPLKAKSRQKIHIGDYFAVPLNNGEYGMGQIVADLTETTGAFACIILNQKHQPDAAIKVDENNIIALFYVVGSLLKRYFPIIGNQAVDETFALHYFPEIPQYRQWETVGMTTSQTGIVEMFLNAYFALDNWDGCYDPHYYDSLLISPDKKPKILKYKNPL